MLYGLPNPVNSALDRRSEDMRKRHGGCAPCSSNPDPSGPTLAFKLPCTLEIGRLVKESIL